MYGGILRYSGIIWIFIVNNHGDMGVSANSHAEAGRFICWNRENSTQSLVTALVRYLYWKVDTIFDNLNPPMSDFALYFFCIEHYSWDPSLDILTPKPDGKKPQDGWGCGGWLVLVLRQWRVTPLGNMGVSINGGTPKMDGLWWKIPSISIYKWMITRGIWWSINIIGTMLCWYDLENNEDEAKDDLNEIYKLQSN